MHESAPFVPSFVLVWKRNLLCLRLLLGAVGCGIAASGMGCILGSAALEFFPWLLALATLFLTSSVLAVALVRYRFRHGTLVTGKALETTWIRGTACIRYSYEWEGRERRGIDCFTADERPPGSFGLPITLVASPLGAQVVDVYRA